MEKILSKMNPQEMCSTCPEVNHRFRAAARNVMLSNFRLLGHLIVEHLNNTKCQIYQMALDTGSDNLEREMICVAQYTFLQILYSEYKVLCTVFLDHESASFSNLIFKMSTNLEEFHRLLSGASINQWDWRTGNVSTTMDHLRNLNSKIVDTFFWKFWDYNEAHFGPMLLKLLDCSLSTKYSITVTHEANLKYNDAKCHIFGFYRHYEIADLSNTLASPPGGLQQFNSSNGIRVLAAYICNAIRWGNMFHSLRLRWICMDRALALGRRQRSGWPLFDLCNQYGGSTSSNLSSEVIQELRNGEKRLVRVLEKTSQEPQLPSWVGIKCEFQLWCPVSEAPPELLGVNGLKNLPESSATSSCTKPYHFKMEFKTYVRSISTRSQGIIESTVWVEETQAIKIIQSRQMV
ncbi:hypothetical protein AAG570_010665 [Ranatra chinensis]|uniref:Uncharacterized protein n=1 Tax=Ranatra chinensis TaxID=642074 RepID=A0ABD0Z9A4_9HEMI